MDFLFIFYSSGSCSLDCGVNGECLGSACACKPGE